MSLNSGLLYAGLNDWSLGLGHTIFRERLSNVAPDVILSPLDTGEVNLSFLSSQLTFDRRDSPVNPRKGFAFSLGTRLSSEILASDADYFDIQSENTVLIPQQVLGEDFVVASKSRFGKSWSFADTDEIPISQRYYLGGRTSLRGFRENSIGPLGNDSGVIGGDSFFAQNLELQWFVNEFSSLNLFFDFGGVFLDSEGFDRSEIRESAGVGLRFLSPVGPIGFDIATPLDERSGEPSVRFHFSIGTNY